MDNALLVSHTLAPQKAWTAVALKNANSRTGNAGTAGGDCTALRKKKISGCFGGGFPCCRAGAY
ncbi:heme-binding protein (plasmid) [Escherichia coli]|nr:heme-binding protein [Escherichia coli]